MSADNRWIAGIPKLASPGTPHSRSTIGGSPIVAEGQIWPMCSTCGERQLFCLQFDINQNFGTRLKSGSHFLLFACPADIQGGDPTDTNNLGGTYSFIFNKAGLSEKNLEEESRLVPFNLEWSDDDTVDPGSWPWGIYVSATEAEKPEDWLPSSTCSCGANMIFLGMIGDEYPFPIRRGATVPMDDNNSDWQREDQLTKIYPVSDSKDIFDTKKISEVYPGVAKNYPNMDCFQVAKLFYGNALLIFVCENQCSSNSVRAVQTN